MKLCQSKDNDIVNFRFFGVNSWYTVLDSFLPQTTNDKYCEAIEKSLIWSISKHDLEKLSDEFDCIEQIYGKLVSMAAVNMMKPLQNIRMTWLKVALFAMILILLTTLTMT